MQSQPWETITPQAHLGGFYIPGRDGSSVLDALGLMSVIGSLLVAGVLTVSSRKK